MFDGYIVSCLQELPITVEDLSVRSYIELRTDLLLQLDDGGVGGEGHLHSPGAVLHMHLEERVVQFAILVFPASTDNAEGNIGLHNILP